MKTVTLNNITYTVEELRDNTIVAYHTGCELTPQQLTGECLGEIRGGTRDIGIVFYRYTMHQEAVKAEMEGNTWDKKWILDSMI